MTADTYQGKPCKYGHGTERYVNDRNCVTCRRLKSLRYYRSHGQERKQKRDNKRNAERWSTEPNYRMAKSLRRAVRDLYMEGETNNLAGRNLGCPPDMFVRRVEHLFEPGMRRDNYGKVWEFRFIRQLHTFDLTDPEQLAAACHFENIRPAFRPSEYQRPQSHQDAHAERKSDRAMARQE